MLISERHRQLYQDYYAAQTFQTKPNQWLSRIESLAQSLQAISIIDYGCGSARSIAAFTDLRVTEYDPGIFWCASVPTEKADLVVSIHMLEHVEPDCVDAVLDHMISLAKKAVLVVVSCEQSTKTLPDGSPWHTFVHSADWWRARLSDFREQPTLKAAGLEYAALKA